MHVVLGAVGFQLNTVPPVFYRSRKDGWGEDGVGGIELRREVALEAMVIDHAFSMGAVSPQTGHDLFRGLEVGKNTYSLCLQERRCP